MPEMQDVPHLRAILPSRSNNPPEMGSVEVKFKATNGD